MGYVAQVVQTRVIGHISYAAQVVQSNVIGHMGYVAQVVQTNLIGHMGYVAQVVQTNVIGHIGYVAQVVQTHVIGHLGYVAQVVQTNVIGYIAYVAQVVQTHVIGHIGYVAQLNILRAQERRKPDTITSVNQPFNRDSFNFTKIKPGEILFEMQKLESSKDDCGQMLRDRAVTVEVASKNTEIKVCNQVVINVSPLEYGHVLLLPDVQACNPQILTKYAVELSVDLLLLSKHSLSSSYRVCCTSKRCWLPRDSYSSCMDPHPHCSPGIYMRLHTTSTTMRLLTIFS
ncbi:hypothetical protein DPMN_097288 [Dreissena polymorpha]|uniref:GDPGP1-like N-terminal domain-containing protein n=1 Tax=Dreissena polymorpha TaxID=45954 RepID=A0A9D4LBH0_DREPO|nr:hypothetical protein DPMN_097288 [Dreissena polymorpha]